MSEKKSFRLHGLSTSLMAGTPTVNSKFPVKEEDHDDDLPEEIERGGCCFSFPCFGSSQSVDSNWERIAFTPSKLEDTANSSAWNPLAKGVKALKKVREWSELVAGPKWKTFIRRFNRHRCSKNGVKFQYDPLSYAMNFDEGPGQNGLFREDDDRLFRDFSSRYAAISITSKS